MAITITRDLNVCPVGVPPVIHLSQYDSDFTLVFNLYASTGTFTVPTGTTAEIRGTKRDGNGYDADATVSGTTVTVTGNEQMTAIAGANIYEIALYKNSKQLFTSNFILAVEPSALDANTITSESVLKELNDIIAGAATATQAALDAEDALEEVESIASDLLGFNDDTKQALLDCFAHAAWINADGQNYYDALEDALYPQYPMISASFNSRGHVVFTSDSLDSLKDYLTVTYFETRESEGVALSSSEYTLSGTLSSGSNSITVLYSTLRANFDVIAVAMTVPSGYTRKDYVKIKESYPNGIPTAALLFVNTGYDLNTLSYFVDLYVEQQVSGSGGVAMFGGRSASGSGSSVAIYYNHSSFTLGVHVHGSDPGVISGFENVIQLQKIYHTSLVNGSASPSVLSTGEESRNIVWTNSNVVNVPLAYFVNKNNADSASATNWASSYLRLGIFEIKNISNETIRYLIPVVRDSDNVIGIYDGITGAFYCPSSTNYSKIGNSNCKYEVGMW